MVRAAIERAALDLCLGEPEHQRHGGAAGVDRALVPGRRPGGVTHLHRQIANPQHLRGASMGIGFLTLERAVVDQRAAGGVQVTATFRR